MAIAFVAGVQFTAGPATTTIVFDALDCSAGDLLSVGVGWEDGGASDAATATIADDAGNNWVIEGGVSTTGAEDQKAYKFHCLSSNAQLANVITVTISAARGSRTGYAARYTHDNAVTLVDDNSGFSDTNVASITTGDVAIETGDLLTMWVQHNSTSATLGEASSGFTRRDTFSAGPVFASCGFSDWISDTTDATYTPTVGFSSGTDSYVAMVSVFRESAGGGGTGRGRLIGGKLVGGNLLVRAA